MSELECITIEPQSTAESCIIWLHGLGADGNDFVPVVGQLDIPSALNIRYIFPHAPIMPVTINEGLAMRAWYDITMSDLQLEEDVAGVEASTKQVQDLIDEQVNLGINPKKIILAGFSQGGVISLHAGLNHKTAIGGIIALSCYMPLQSKFIAELQHNTQTPVFMAHGLLDPVVPLPLGEQARNLLEEKKYDLQWCTYPMMHQVCPEELQDISLFITKVFSTDANLHHDAAILKQSDKR